MSRLAISYIFYGIFIYGAIVTGVIGIAICNPWMLCLTIVNLILLLMHRRLIKKHRTNLTKDYIDKYFDLEIEIIKKGSKKSNIYNLKTIPND